MTAAFGPKAGAPAKGGAASRQVPSSVVPWFNLALLAPLAAFLLVMVVYPLVMAVMSSLGLAQPVKGLPDSFTLEGYREFFDLSGPALEALWFTFKVTTVAAVLSTGVGVTLAIYMKLRDIELPVFLSFIMKLPLLTPYLVIAFIFWIMLYPAGYVVNILQVLKNFIADYYILFETKPMLVNDPLGVAIILCATWMRFPYGFIMAENLLAMTDPSYEEAARNLGASRRVVVWRIYLPLIKYGLLSAALLNFLALFIAFSIPFVLGSSWPQFLSVFIYVNAKDQGDWLGGYTAAVVYVAIAFAIGYVYARSLERSRANA
jgi:putative spermidine/putrescine transport system permease protein